MEETYDQFHEEGHPLIAEIRHEDANINARFDFNLTSVNPNNLLESTLMMDAYSFLDEASILCGKTLDVDYVTTTVSIINGIYNIISCHIIVLL